MTNQLLTDFKLIQCVSKKTITNIVATDDLANADSIVTAKWNVQYPLFYYESCVEHLFPTGSRAWNNSLSHARQMTLCSEQEPNCSWRKQSQGWRERRLISQKQMLGGWHKGSKGDSSDCHPKKKWENTNREQKKHFKKKKDQACLSIQSY